MKKSNQLAIFSLASIIMVAALIGCSEKSTPTDQTTSQNMLNPFSPNISGSIKAWLAASITDNDWYRYTDVNQTNIKYTTDADYKIADAVFYTDVQVDPGIVEFNNVSLLNSGANYFYRPPIDVRLDGFTYIWSVGGSSLFPAFTDSLVSPLSKARISSPTVFTAI